jgi:hypothetical protein
MPSRELTSTKSPNQRRRGEPRAKISPHDEDALAPIPKYVAWVAGIWIAGHYIVQAITALSGHQTDASFVVKILLNLQADRWIAYIVGGGGVVYGWNERRLKRKDIERLSRHTEELEKRLDPKRTSSNLLPDGRTRREDK